MQNNTNHLLQVSTFFYFLFFHHYFHIYTRESCREVRIHTHVYMCMYIIFSFVVFLSFINLSINRWCLPPVRLNSPSKQKEGESSSSLLGLSLSYHSFKNGLSFIGLTCFLIQPLSLSFFLIRFKVVSVWFDRSLCLVLKVTSRRSSTVLVVIYYRTFLISLITFLIFLYVLLISDCFLVWFERSRICCRLVTKVEAFCFWVPMFLMLFADLSKSITRQPSLLCC